RLRRDEAWLHFFGAWRGCQAVPSWVRCTAPKGRIALKIRAKSKDFFSLARFLLASFFKRHCAIRQVPRHLCMMASLHLMNSCLRLYLLVLKIIHL
ncbi:MAG TPA: hypothetical protein PLB17_07350, partial [Comamonas denitrificans]|nr:hypothetical protein [Comamonas denitrificans]